jgi:uncharacterized protein (DUF433 family)
MATPPIRLTPREAAFVAGVPHRVVQQAIDRDHVARPLVIRRRDTRALTPAGAFLIAADYRLGRTLAPGARARLRLHLVRNADPQRLPHLTAVDVSKDGLQVVVSLGRIREEIAGRLAALRRTLRLVVEDPDVQGGAPTFKGTRITVRPVAMALARGVSRQEMSKDYGLTAEMFEAARIYDEVRPARGRPGRHAARGLARSRGAARAA